jgi:hypothetical protein
MFDEEPDAPLHGECAHEIQRLTKALALSKAENARMTDHVRVVEAEAARLEALVNNPQTAEFLSAVKAEAAHQIEKWGEAHDRGKSAENWFWLVGYLSGKALRAVISGDRHKALHHTISSAAALANWHAAITRDTTGAGMGHDLDIKPIELARFEDAQAVAA